MQSRASGSQGELCSITSKIWLGVCFLLLGCGCTVALTWPKYRMLLQEMSHLLASVPSPQDGWWSLQSGAQDKWGEAEGTGLFQPGEKKAKGETALAVLSHIMGYVREQMEPEVLSSSEQGVGCNLQQGKCQWDLWKGVFTGRWNTRPHLCVRLWNCCPWRHPKPGWKWPWAAWARFQAVAAVSRWWAWMTFQLWRCLPT